ncbi:glycosyltransferase [Williamsia maris]|uniref:4,4'-diaponeurosporenoate glycosyltransferase n=1 Tax=Williamsia maris TaxID=72806 RepID=A0ABT1HEQ5_9NOCA|nr:Glycosyl transferase family 2 [Williamsia maris]
MGNAEGPAVAVIVPMYNEKHLVLDTLRALEAQRFDQPVHRDVLGGFRVILVDNNSTDDTATIVSDFILAGTTVPFEMITEREKGTGSAADAGARRAIELGATYIARTDADTLPAPDWLASITAPLLSGKRLVGGRVRARSGDGMQSTVFNAVGRLWRVGHLVEWVRTRNHDPDKRRSFAVVGNNLAIDAEMYEKSGGFPRTSIEEADEDQVLQQRVRAITGGDGIALAPNAIVYTSLRRLDEYGTQGFVSWYASSDRTATEQNTDIR